SADITADEWDIPTGRGATLVVAASDAYPSSKAQADYVVDGTADQVELQAAEALLATLGGGTIQLTEGNFDINGDVTPGLPAIAGAGFFIYHSNIYLRGVPGATILRGSGTNSNAVVLLGALAIGSTVENIGVMDVVITAPAAPTNGLAIFCSVGAVALKGVLVQNIIIEDIFLDVTGGKGIGIGGSVTDSVTDVIIRDFIIKDADYYGIDSTHAVGVDSINNVVISNFRMENNKQNIKFTAPVGNVLIANGFITTGEYGIDVTGSTGVVIDSVEVSGQTIDGFHIYADGTILSNVVARDNNRNVRISADDVQFEGKVYNSTAEEGLLVVGNNGRFIGLSENNIKEGFKAQLFGGHYIDWKSIEDGQSGIFLNNADHNVITGSVYRAGWYGVYLYEATHNTVTGMILRDNSQAADNTYTDISVNSNSNYNRIIGNISEATLATNVHTNFYESGDSTDNVYLGNYASGGQTNRWNLLGTTTTVDHMPESITLDLSGGATDTEVFHAQHDMAIVGYTIYYTEASSGDAGVVVRIGRYQDGVALDGDYFDSVTSEINKNLGYQKVMVSSDMTQKAIAAGDTITVGTAGGKAGTGEVRIVLRIIEAGN
ncbi:hypothetical protein LCGC14_0925720, partial [marine sediment metagenome]